MCAVVTAGARSVDVVDRMSSWARSKCRPQKPDPDGGLELPVTVTKKSCPVDSWFMIHILQLHLHLHLHLYTITITFYIACTYLEFFSSWSSSIEFVYRLKLPPCAACPRRSSGRDERWATQWTWENHRWIFLQAMFDTVGYLPLHPITVHPMNIQVNPVNIPFNSLWYPIKSQFFWSHNCRQRRIWKRSVKRRSSAYWAPPGAKTGGVACVDRLLSCSAEKE